MRWPWKRSEHTPAADYGPDAVAARERARAAAGRADQAVAENTRLTGEIRRERKANHFAPIILDAIRKER